MDTMRAVIEYLCRKGWVLRKHINHKPNGIDDAGTDRFQFVKKDGTKTWTRMRLWFVQSFIQDKDSMVKQMETDGIK